MAQRDRLNDIMNILQQQGYVTVKYLTAELHYSTATINRDLNFLQKQGLIHRSYGGAELTEPKEPPLIFRYHKMKTVKRRIGREAASFVRDGDTIFIDPSTTGQYIAPYLTDRKDLTVISNNMALLTYLSEYGIHCICLGGDVVETPSMLYGPMTAMNVRAYRADKMFFSTTGITEKGRISCYSLYLDLYHAMAENSDLVFYINDHEKINTTGSMYLDLPHLDYVISDYEFPEETRRRMPCTEFVFVKP